MPRNPIQSDHAPVDAPVRETAGSARENGMDGEMLRAVMRHVASPVTIVTASAGGERRGATIGSFTSVSLEPPLVSFNVQKGSGLHDVLLATDVFAVHLLGDEQADLADHFALPDLTSEAQFRGAVYAHGGPDQPPILAGVPGMLYCRRWAVHDAGDHSLFLGRVLRVTESDAGGPLLYYDRSYRAIGDEV